MSKSGVLRPHVPVLDGLRGVAVLMVILIHASSTWVPLAKADWIAAAFMRSGWVGVDLFFVLSGFLITGGLLDARGGPGYFKNFYARRVLRIFPLYYAWLIVLLVAVPAIGVTSPAWARPGDDGLYWLFLANFADFLHPGSINVSGVAWTLAIEEQFYLVWPLAVLLLGRRGVQLLAPAVVGITLAFRVGMILVGTDHTTLGLLTPGRLDGLAVGAWIATQARSEQQLQRLVRPAQILVVCLGVCALATGVWLHGLWSDLLPMLTIGLSLLALLFGAILVLALTSTHGLQHRVLSIGWLRAWGRYSYAAYLFNLPIMMFLREHILNANAVPAVFGSSVPGLAVFTLLGASVTFVCAWLSWHLLERRCLELKRFFVPARQQAPPAARANVGACARPA
jgi:peptidoglycan/LPS O-acetylase OafA/YrhL